MNSLLEYFHTEWAEMTVTDWVGTILTVVIFLLMVGLYLYVLSPKKRDLEEKKYIPLDDEENNFGEKNGR